MIIKPLITGRRWHPVNPDLLVCSTCAQTPSFNSQDKSMLVQLHNHNKNCNMFDLPWNLLPCSSEQIDMWQLWKKSMSLINTYWHKDQQNTVTHKHRSCRWKTNESQWSLSFNPTGQIYSPINDCIQKALRYKYHIYFFLPSK